MTAFFLSSLRLGLPLIFAGMGGVIAESSGVVTLCLEGTLLVSAFAAAVVSYSFESSAMGLIAGMLAGCLFMGIHAFFTQKARIDHIISGVALNLCAAGLTPLFCKMFFDSTTNTPSLPEEVRIHSLIPFFICALAVPILVHFLLKHSRFGLRLRAAGDGPEALTTAGVSVTQVRTQALLLAGVVISLGGSYLSIAHSDQFIRDMTSGKGFIALAAVILGKWKPLPTFLACIFFSCMEALQLVLQNTAWRGFVLPVQWVQAIPYILTLIVLVSVSARKR